MEHLRELTNTKHVDLVADYILSRGLERPPPELFRKAAVGLSGTEPVFYRELQPLLDLVIARSVRGRAQLITAPPGSPIPIEVGAEPVVTWVGEGKPIAFAKIGTVEREIAKVTTATEAPRRS